MDIITPPATEPVITVFRKKTGANFRYWFFSNSRPVEMAERLALQDAKRGKIRIETVKHA